MNHFDLAAAGCNIDVGNPQFSRIPKITFMSVRRKNWIGC